MDLSDISWSSIPTDQLIAELSKRQDNAGEDGKPTCGTEQKGAYNTPLHVFALVLILALSTLACGFPLFSRRSSKSRRTSYIIFICQHFGTGVLIATAFVHLLPTAFTSLTDPCLPDAFSKGYKPMAGLVSMLSALLVVALESFLTTRGARHSHAHGWDSDDEHDHGHGHSHGDGNKSYANGRRRADNRPSDIALEEYGSDRGLMADESPLPSSIPKDRDDEDDDDLDLDELDPHATGSESQSLARPGSHRHSSHMKEDSEAPLPQGPTDPEQQKRMMLQCLLLEAGILFHSVFIGMAVSVATGPPFVVFLIAIGFHQTFEGLALGSRIAALHFPKSSIRPWLMVLAYGCTTPLGQAIGLAVHSLYDPKSAAGLLMVGFMNAISSGLLLFAGLVQLLAEDFLTEKSYQVLKGKERTRAGIAVLSGATLMALVGAWA